MSDQDKPDGTVGKASEPSTGGADARATPARSGQPSEETIEPAPSDPGLSPDWHTGNRSPASGLILAIPASVILWAVLIYLLTRLG